MFILSFIGDPFEATVTTSYIIAIGNDKLKIKLKSEMLKGTRIINHNFKITNWHHSKDVLLPNINKYTIADEINANKEKNINL